MRESRHVNNPRDLPSAPVTAGPIACWPQWDFHSRRPSFLLTSFGVSGTIRLNPNLP